MLRPPTWETRSLSLGMMITKGLHFFFYLNLLHSKLSSYWLPYYYCCISINIGIIPIPFTNFIKNNDSYHLFQLFQWDKNEYCSAWILLKGGMCSPDFMLMRETIDFFTLRFHYSLILKSPPAFEERSVVLYLYKVYCV